MHYMLIYAANNKFEKSLDNSDSKWRIKLTMTSLDGFKRSFQECSKSVPVAQNRLVI